MSGSTEVFAVVDTEEAGKEVAEEAGKPEVAEEAEVAKEAGKPEVAKAAGQEQTT